MGTIYVVICQKAIFYLKTLLVVPYVHIMFIEHYE